MEVEVVEIDDEGGPIGVKKRNCRQRFVLVEIFALRTWHAQV